MENFSIKSKLGKPVLLFSANTASSFIYEIIGSNYNLNYVRSNLKSIQHVESNDKDIQLLNISTTLKNLEKRGCKLSYYSVDDPLYSNLMLVDSRMPNIAAELLEIYYMKKSTELVNNAVEQILIKNSLSIDEAKLYTHKIKSLLCAMALGMNSATDWDGTEHTENDYTIVNVNGEAVANHAINRNLFKEYLLSNTRFDAPRQSDYGYIYEDNDKILINLHMQIRFV